jgi:acetyl esterase/lipase
VSTRLGSALNARAAGDNRHALQVSGSAARADDPLRRRWRLIRTVIAALSLYFVYGAKGVCADDVAQPQTSDAGVLALIETLRTSTPRQVGPVALYDGDIPNSRPSADLETHSQIMGMDTIRRVSRPTYTAYLPAPSRASGAAVVIFPGGGYEALSWDFEGTRIAAALQDRGIAAIIVKYRLPSDETMIDKSIGPLQDGQQALRQVRSNATAWSIDPDKVGVMGFSAGGHLAANLGTQFETSFVPNPDSRNLRPDFMILVYPVISMVDDGTNSRSREVLLGAHPNAAQVRRFSGDLQVSGRTPPTLLLAAENDSLVDVDHSIRFFEALRHKDVPVAMMLFSNGQHGFFQLSRDEWMSPMWAWLAKNGWLKP